MSVWGILFAPLAAVAMDEGEGRAPSQFDAAAVEITDAGAREGGLFSDLAVMGDADMRAASGGSHTAVDIGFVNINNSENGADLGSVTVANTTNGQIANNTISNNSGVTTVFNNTGNGVILQSNVNVNVFMTDPAP